MAFFFGSLIQAFSQEEKLLLRDGNKAFQAENYEEAETHFSEAGMINNKIWEADFNLGNTYFKQERYAEAASQFERVASKMEDKIDKAKAYHNLGNSLLMENKLKKSIEAYKNALRNNPNDDDTRYNLAVAQKLLKEQEENPEQQEDENQENEENEDQEKEENQNKEDDKEGDGDDNQEQEKNENQDEKEGDQEQKQSGEDGEGNPESEEQLLQMSREDAERLLESQQNKEREIQQMLMKNKLKGEKRKIEKDW